MMTKDIGTAGSIAGLWYPDPDIGLPFYQNFEDISRGFLEGYRTLIDQGMLPATIASAMLGATVNLYEMFEMKSQLPSILRAMADRLEDGAQLS
jgi:hypothetical protein